MAYTHFYQSVAATLMQELSTHISGTSDDIHLISGIALFSALVKKSTSSDVAVKTLINV
jgi:hypothetical protein